MRNNTVIFSTEKLKTTKVVQQKLRKFKCKVVVNKMKKKMCKGQNSGDHFQFQNKETVL